MDWLIAGRAAALAALDLWVTFRAWLRADDAFGAWLLGGSAIALVIIVLVLADLTGGRGWPAFWRALWPWPWRARLRGEYVARSVLTANEAEFYHRLSEALPHHLIFAQVAMSALLEPAVVRAHPDFLRRRNAVAQKYCDYAVVDPTTLIPVAIVELDDVTHDPVKDARRDAMLEGAGYVVLRWESQQKPTAAMIAKAVRRAARAARNGLSLGPAAGYVS